MKREIRSYNNIFITGMPACGKSTFAKMYAAYTRSMHIDFDDFFEKTFNIKINKLIQTKGLEAFRKKESDLLPKLLEHKNTIVSLGGGTILAQKNYQLIRDQGLIVGLIGLPAEVIAQRVLSDKESSKKRKRPLFAHCQTFELILDKINELYKNREASYLKADILLNQYYNSSDNLMLMLKNYEMQYTQKKIKQKS